MWASVVSKKRWAKTQKQLAAAAVCARARGKNNPTQCRGIRRHPFPVSWGKKHSWVVVLCV